MFNAQAATWNRAGKVTAIGRLPGDSFSLANDSSYFGQVLGASGSENYVKTRAFVWHRGVMRHVKIGKYPYASLEAFGWFGSMVGNAWTKSLNADGQGFVTNCRGKVKMIGLLKGGSISQLFDVNLFGTAVGLADDGKGPPKALIYRRGELKSLGALTGDDFSMLSAINTWGTAVGISAGRTGPRAVISYFGGELVDLNTRVDLAKKGKLLVYSANGINDRGEIAAGAVDFTKTPPVGITVKLTPISK